MAAYALVRVRFEIKLAAIGAFVIVLVLTVAAVSLGWLALAGRGRPPALPCSCCSSPAFNRRFKRSVGNNDIQFWFISNRILPPVVVVLPIYVMFQQLRPARHACRRDRRPMWRSIFPIVVWLMRDFFAAIPIDLEESAHDRRRLAAAHLLDDRAAADQAGPRGDIPARLHPGVERISAGALHLDRERTDDAAAGRGSERHPRTAMVVHVGADPPHDRAGRRSFRSFCKSRSRAGCSSERSRDDRTTCASHCTDIRKSFGPVEVVKGLDLNVG